MNAIAINGLLDCHNMEEGNVDGVMPFNGTNPQSVIVLENASIHYVDEFRCTDIVPSPLLTGL